MAEFRRKGRDASRPPGTHLWLRSAGESAPGLASTKELSMVRYRIAGIPDSLARAARESLASPQYGHPAHLELATGYGPCRLCLQTFREGEEERLLFTYQPFSDAGALPAPGPVFIHRDECQRYDDLTFPEGLRHLPLAVDAYAPGGRLVRQERVGRQPVESVLDSVFAAGVVAYAHLRNAEAGCFIARIERSFACD